MNNKKINYVIVTLVLVIFGLLAFVAYMIANNNSKNSTLVNQTQDEQQVPVSESYNFENEDAETTVDETIDSIQNDLDSLDLDTDFEDFDAELEFGNFE